MESATALTNAVGDVNEEGKPSSTQSMRLDSSVTLRDRFLASWKTKKVKEFQDGCWGFCLCVHFRLIDSNGICCSCGSPMEIRFDRELTSKL